jgi:hypothetical protein
MALYLDLEMTELYLNNSEGIEWSGTNSSDYKLTFSTYLVKNLTTLYLGRMTRGNRRSIVPLTFEVVPPPGVINADFFKTLNKPPKFVKEF